MSVRRASTNVLAQRSVHLRIVPRPTNLSESREIFRVLQRFGEISTYKHLRHEYHNPADNTAIAIYRDADSAQQALDASPIRFALERVAPEDDSAAQEVEDFQEEDQIVPETPRKDGIDEILQPSRLLNRAPPPTTTPTASPSQTSPPMPFAEPPPPRNTIPKWFQVTVDRSRVIHQDYVERQPYWKQFSPMKSIAQEDLSKKVPHPGLSDVSKRPPDAHRTPNKVLKLMNRYLEHGMPSLVDMYEEGGEGVCEKKGHHDI